MDPTNCQRCGSTHGLSWHHIDPSTKKFSIGGPLHRVTAREVEEEKAKCVRLCHQCHQVIHSDLYWWHGERDYRRHMLDFLRNPRNILWTLTRGDHHLLVITSTCVQVAWPGVGVRCRSVSPHHPLPVASTFGGGRALRWFLHPELIAA